MSGYIKVKVKAGAKRENVIKKDDDSYEISVREPARRNEANSRVKEIVAGLYGKRGAVRIKLVSGARSRSKIFQLIKD